MIATNCVGECLTATLKLDEVVRDCCELLRMQTAISCNWSNCVYKFLLNNNSGFSIVARDFTGSAVQRADSFLQTKSLYPQD